MSALKRLVRRPLLISVIACILLLIVLLVVTRPPHPQPAVTKEYDVKQVTFGDAATGSKYHMQVADTDAKRERGLSNRDTLTGKTGMIFTYDKPQQLCFWMKDMRFAIDMVWLDQTKHVVAVESAVSPNSYPKTFCHQAQYVLEFSAGTAGKERLQAGKQLAF